MRKHTAADSHKKLKLDTSKSLALAEPVKQEVVKMEKGQIGIRASLESGKADEVDSAIAEMFYGLNLPPNKVNHPLVKKAFKAMQTAPASYKLPSADRLGYDLLESTTAKLQAEEKPVRDDMLLRHGGTVISDGWDDVTGTHLINILLGVCGG
eukprot:5915785-Prymnesium_polylepis.1